MPRGPRGIEFCHAKKRQRGPRGILTGVLLECRTSIRKTNQKHGQRRVAGPRSGADSGRVRRTAPGERRSPPWRLIGRDRAGGWCPSCCT